MCNKKHSWQQRNYSKLDLDSFGGPSMDQNNLIPPTKHSSKGTDVWFWKLYYYCRFLYIKNGLVGWVCNQKEKSTVFRGKIFSLSRCPIVPLSRDNEWTSVPLSLCPGTMKRLLSRCPFVPGQQRDFCPFVWGTRKSCPGGNPSLNLIWTSSGH